jgi:hypothetical protein
MKRTDGTSIGRSVRVLRKLRHIAQVRTAVRR